MKAAPKQTENRTPGSPGFLSYHEIPFGYLHQELQLRKDDFGAPPSCRAQFWQGLPSRVYHPEAAQSILGRYLELVEQQIAHRLRRQSITYWLHLYRRIAPRGIGRTKTPATILTTRGILEAAMQKYARPGLCDRIGFSDEVEPQKILNGMLMDPALNFVRRSLDATPQLVLTQFGVNELAELYHLEVLAYEIWQTMAQMRITGKGASLVVNRERGTLGDDRTPWLNELVTRYDGRRQTFNHSAMGVVFSSRNAGKGILLPRNNVAGSPDTQLAEQLLRVHGVALGGDFVPNFTLQAVNIAAYFEAHLPLANSFEAQRHVSLASVVAVVSTLSAWAMVEAIRSPGRMLNLYQRAYEGPFAWDQLLDLVKSGLSDALAMSGLPIGPAEVDVPSALRFLRLGGPRNEEIDVSIAGPHAAILPFGDKGVVIDYAWLHERLYSLFFGVKLDDQNFKGDALEALVRQPASLLPTGPCKALNNTRKQIDAAFGVDDCLVVVECRAVGKSIGVDRGSPVAIEYRTSRIEKALQDCDEKARWLASNPKGRNFDISGFNRIVPIAVTPFVEFIPTLDQRYWITSDLPRCMTPDELSAALDSATFSHVRGGAPYVITLAN